MLKRLLRKWLELDMPHHDLGDWDSTIQITLDDKSKTRDNLRYRAGYRFNMYQTNDCNWVVEITNDVDCAGTFQNSNFTKLYVISNDKNIGEELNKILFLEKMSGISNV